MFGTIKGKARQLSSQLLASQCYLKLCVCVCVCCEDLKILARNNTQHTKINCSCYKGNRCILNSFVFNFHYKICGLAVQLSGKAIASHTSPRFTLSSSSFFPGLSPLCLLISPSLSFHLLPSFFSSSLGVRQGAPSIIELHWRHLGHNTYKSAFLYKRKVLAVQTFSTSRIHSISKIPCF